MRQHKEPTTGKLRLIPLTWKAMTWHDKRYIEEYFCNHTKTYFKQSSFKDAIGTVAYTEAYYFNFRCELLNIANDKIRIHYWIPRVRGEIYANYTNDHPKQLNQNKTLAQLETVSFYRTSDFKAQFICELDQELVGLKSWSAFFHTSDGKNLTKFNNWNFSSSYWWDSVEAGFWFHENTTILYYTIPYIVGKD